uniref:Uncharacterized protein n=1 Tax=Anopheles arabiensis TaxID=7173 RepID=A0A182IHQ9_ANOAR
MGNQDNKRIGWSGYTSHITHAKRNPVHDVLLHMVQST